MSRRGELYRTIAEAFAELAALDEDGVLAAPPAPRSRPRARPARVPCNDVAPPILTDLDARAARIVAQKLRTTRP